MPFNAKQRRLFHAEAERGVPDMAKLANEADTYAREGKELPDKEPVRKAYRNVINNLKPKR